MIICGVTMLERSDWVTGMGPVVRAPPLAARPLFPLVKSDMDAFSSARSGVRGYGWRMASSSTKRMADAVRWEIRRAGCGSNLLGSRARRASKGLRFWCGLSVAKRTERCGGCGGAGSTGGGGVRYRCRASSRRGVRRRLCTALPSELEARE